MLTIAERTQVWRGLMRFWSRQATRQPLTLTKFDLYHPALDTGAVRDVDEWIEAHQGLTAADQVGLNGALGVVVRGNLNLAQKTLLLCAVAAARVGPQALAQVLGGVD